MSQTVTISSVNANLPVNIYYCDSMSASCVFVSTVSVFPYTFTVPDPYDNSNFVIKIIDSDNCIIGNTILITPTPTPTIQTTPTNTPTNTVTPSITPTNTVTPSITPTNTVTPSITPTNTVTPSITPTNTMTPSITPTNTMTPSVTPTIPETPTNTPTNTVTPSITPTNTQTPTNTLTPSITPTNTQTPTVTPTGGLFYAYVFPEPQDSTSQNDLGTFIDSISSSNATYYGYSNSGVPAGPSYASDMEYYVQYPGWTGGSGNFITNVSTLSNLIRQSSGTGVDSEGCPQNQYTFGSIGITTSNVNPSIQYIYTVWIPLNGVGGTLNNMTLDVGIGTACSTTIIDNGIPDSGNAGVNVNVPIGCAIPSGTYRVLWMNELYLIPTTPPLASTLWIKGDTKS